VSRRPPRRVECAFPVRGRPGRGRPVARRPAAGGRGRQIPRVAGVALLTVMLVLSIAAVTAVAMVAQEQVSIRRTGNLLGAEQAYGYALGVESRFQGILDADRDEEGVDGPADPWAAPFGPVDVGEARVEGQVEDLQARFNVNNLWRGDNPSPIDIERFDRLLQTLDVRSGVRQALLDWIDPDDEPRFPGGAEDEAYLRATPAHRAANQLMVSASELRLVAGVGPEEYERLAPYVVALPERTSVNLNTAPAAVLRALFKGLSEDDARRLIDARRKQPFAHVDEALIHPALAGLEVSPDGLSVGSSWFRVRARAESGSGRAELVSTVLRPQDGAPAVWMRERGER